MEKHRLHNILVICSFIYLIILTIIIIYFDRKKIDKLLSLTKSPLWVFNIILVVLFSLFIYYYMETKKKTKHKKEYINIQNSLINSLIALLIAIFASLDLTVLPFWFFFVFDYFIKWSDFKDED